MFDDLTYLEYDKKVKETEKAILFDFDGEEVWIPKSQIVDLDEDIVVIPEWLAEKKELF